MDNKLQTNEIYELVESLAFNGKKYLLRDSSGVELVWDERSVKGLLKSGTVIKGLRLNTFGKIVKVNNFRKKYESFESLHNVDFYKNEGAFDAATYLSKYVDVLPPASVEACRTKEDCNALLKRLGLK